MNALLSLPRETETETSTELVSTPALSRDLYDRFIAYLDASPKTVETYRKTLKQMFVYFHLNGITHPTRDDLLAYKHDLQATGHRPATVQIYMTAARLFFSWTEQEGLFPNIAVHIKGGKVEKGHKKDYLTSGQVRSILRATANDNTLAGLRDYAIILLMVTTGLRTIEVARADVADLRTLGDSTVLYVQGKGKTDKVDYVKISQPVETALRAYLNARGKGNEGQPLVTSTSNNSTGQRLTTRSISGIVKHRMQGAGYDSDRLTAHSLRHTAVTLSLLAGKDITEVQQFARHANIATTMIYNHALDKAKNTCAAAVTASICGA